MHVKTYPDPDGRAETLDGNTVYVASMSELLGLLGAVGAVTKDVMVCVR
jgi:hypothetical protein